jgi:hypothetical protein
MGIFDALGLIQEARREFDIGASILTAIPLFKGENTLRVYITDPLALMRRGFIASLFLIGCGPVPHLNTSDSAII